MLVLTAPTLRRQLPRFTREPHAIIDRKSRERLRHRARRRARRDRSRRSRAAVRCGLWSGPERARSAIGLEPGGLRARPCSPGRGALRGARALRPGRALLDSRRPVRRAHGRRLQALDRLWPAWRLHRPRRPLRRDLGRGLFCLVGVFVSRRVRGRGGSLLQPLAGPGIDRASLPFLGGVLEHREVRC